jgi:hypothetical protein
MGREPRRLVRSGRKRTCQLPPSHRKVPSAASAEAVVHLLATAIEEGRDLSSMSGIQADTAYLLLA